MIMSDGFEEFGIGQNDEDVGKKSNKWKATAGESNRISLVWWPTKEDGSPNLTAPSPRFIKATRGYRPGVGYFLVKGPEFAKLAQDGGKKLVATIIVVWPTNKAGIIDADRFNKGDYEVLPWVFSEDKYTAITSCNAEFPLSRSDLKVTCLDTQFQKLTFNSCDKSMYAVILEKKPALAKKILAQIDEVAENIRNELCRDMTLEQIKAKIAGGGNPSQGNRPASGHAAAQVDVDSLLDDTLAS